MIEDAAHCLEGVREGVRVGELSDAACFSFYPSKNMTTGEGGMITTDSDYIANVARDLRSHKGEIAYNYRMTEIQAAIGIEQLKRLQFFNAKRFQNAQYLARRLGDYVIVPEIVEGHVFNQFTIRVSDEAAVNRNALQVRLEKSGIDSRIYYRRPLSCDCPEAVKASKQVLSLPVYPGLTADDLDKIIEAIREAIGKPYGNTQ